MFKQGMIPPVNSSLDQVLLALVSICADHDARLRLPVYDPDKRACSCNIGDGLPRNFIDRISAPMRIEGSHRTKIASSNSLERHRGPVDRVTIAYSTACTRKLLAHTHRQFYYGIQIVKKLRSDIHFA